MQENVSQLDPFVSIIESIENYWEKVGRNWRRNLQNTMINRLPPNNRENISI